MNPIKNEVKFKKTTKRKDGSTLVKVAYNDKYEINDPKTRKEIEDEIHNNLIPAIEAYKKKKGDNYKPREDNPVSDGLFEQSAVLSRWREDMPTAAALYPLQKPHMNKLANGMPFDEVAEKYFPHAIDGVGLRSRAAIMSYVMFEHFKNYPAKQTLKWSSLACGAAIPVFDAAQALMKVKKTKIALQLLDIDKSALKFAKDLAINEYDISEHIDIKKANILKLKGLVKKVGLESQDAIDILGFFEYLPATTWKYRKYKVRMDMPGAIEFLEAAYSLLKPGGMLVLGNMRDDHPQLPFTIGIVRWPYIRPRKLSRVLEIINKAGIDSKNVTFYQAGDSVYTVAAITKGS